jgi:hypothetical protein
VTAPLELDVPKHDIFGARVGYREIDDPRAIEAREELPVLQQSKSPALQCQPLDELSLSRKQVEVALEHFADFFHVSQEVLLGMRVW